MNLNINKEKASSQHPEMDPLLEYENQIYLDMYHNDALLIMAEGLGIERMFTNFIKVYCDPCCLVLILNTNEAEEEFFMNRLKQSDTGIC